MFCETFNCHIKLFYIMLFLGVFFLVVGFLGMIEIIKITFRASILILATGAMILILNLFSL
jgi:hypothetical protein